MRCTLLTILILYVGCAQLSGQYIEPEGYSIWNATVGAPRYLEFTFTNPHDQPVRFVTTFCMGYADMDVEWLYRSDSTRMDSMLIAPGDTVEGVVRFVPRSSAPLTLSCSMDVLDTLDNRITQTGFGTNGSVTSSPKPLVASSAAQFGSQGLGTSSAKTIMLKNNGNGDAYMRAISKPSAPFTIVDDKIWIVKPNDSVAVTVKFEPSANGDYDDTVAFGYAYIYTSTPLRVRLQGSSGSTNRGLVALSQVVSMDGVLTGGESSANIAFVAASGGAQVASASMMTGTEFSVSSSSHPLPGSIAPDDTLVVSVLFKPVSTGTFTDELLVSVVGGPTIQVVLIGTAVVSGISELASRCSVHPNPAFGTVRWCSEYNDVWVVCNIVGSVVATVSSDNQGNCTWTSSECGTYAMRNVRSGEVMRVVVLK